MQNNQGFIIKNTKKVNLTNASVEKNTIIQSPAIREQTITNTQGYSIEEVDELEVQGAKVEGNIIAEAENTSKKLEQLINSAKEKLKSKSYFSAEREERNQKLESFFKNLPTSQKEFVKNLDSIKQDLSKKLSTEEINELCQAQTENNYLQSQLGKVEELTQQTQILHQPPKNP